MVNSNEYSTADQNVQLINNTFICILLESCTYCYIIIYIYTCIHAPIHGPSYLKRINVNIYVTVTVSEDTYIVVYKQPSSCFSRCEPLPQADSVTSIYLVSYLPGPDDSDNEDHKKSDEDQDKGPTQTGVGLQPRPPPLVSRTVTHPSREVRTTPGHRRHNSSRWRHLKVPFTSMHSKAASLSFKSCTWSVTYFCFCWSSVLLYFWRLRWFSDSVLSVYCVHIEHVCIKFIINNRAIRLGTTDRSHVQGLPDSSIFTDRVDDRNRQLTNLSLSFIYNLIIPAYSQGIFFLNVGYGFSAHDVRMIFCWRWSRNWELRDDPWTHHARWFPSSSSSSVYSLKPNFWVQEGHAYT